MRYVWLPQLYRIIALVFVASFVLYVLQVQNPDRYNKGAVIDLGQRMTVASGGLLIVATFFVFGQAWEQQVIRKLKIPHVELSQRERSYGGTVFVRKLPRRIWKQINEGDRLIKPAWSLVVRVEPRRRRA